MDSQAFTLTDGTVEAQVTGQPDTKTITIVFDVKDTAASTPTLDIAKYGSATAHAPTLREVMQQAGLDVSISEAEMLRDGTIQLSATYKQQAEFESAMDLLRAIQLPPQTHDTTTIPPQATQPARTTDLEQLLKRFQGHPENVPDVAPSKHDEDADSLSFKQRLARTETAAEVKGNHTLIDLDLNKANGMSASVFVLDKSSITGRNEDSESKLVAVRITPGADTVNARSETFRVTSEVEKRLITRDLFLRSSDVYIGKNSAGQSDTGVILVNAGKTPDETYAKVNAVLEQVQQDYAVISSKLGTRHRGEDHHHRPRQNVATISVQRPDQQDAALEARIHANLRTAEGLGLISVTGEPDAVEAWVRRMAADMRKAVEGPQQDPRRSGEGRS